MAGVVAWPSYASSHPGQICMCFRVVHTRTRVLLNSQHSCAHTHRLQKLDPRERRLQACRALAERPVESQGPQSSNVVTDAGTSNNASLSSVHEPQGSTPRVADTVGPSDLPNGHAQGSSYTKAERANLANIPESQMTSEMLRRWRISKANKGRQPWNKGRQHRPETIDRIRERTRAAMLRPEVLARVRANHPSTKHTSVTKAKIGASVSASRRSRTVVRTKQPKASKADADPTGSLSKKDSKDLKPKRKAARAPAAKSPAATGTTAASNTPDSQSSSAVRQAAAKGQPAKGPHSAPADKRVLAEEHRKNISAAIRQKWADPEYRMRALSGMKSGVVQAKRQSTGRVNAAERSREARAQLEAAKARHLKLMEARRTVEALQSALQAGQAQAEALRGDPVGFARQQVMLDDACQLVALAQAKVAELEANTPSLKEVAAELGAKSPTSTAELTQEEEALIGPDLVQEAPFDNDAYKGQQLCLEASSHGRQLQPIASSHFRQSSGSSYGQDTAQPRLSGSTTESSPHLVPTHSYRHGRVQQDGRTGRTAASVGSIAAAELQPA